METIGPSNLPPWDPYVATCPTRQVLDCVANKWAVLVLGLLSERRHRFGELQRGIDGVSQKVLTQTLRSLERDGIVERTVHPTVPPKGYAEQVADLSDPLPNGSLTRGSLAV